MDTSQSHPNGQTQRLRLFLVVLAFWVALFTILAAPGLWLIDKALSPLPLNIKTSTTVPLASRFSLALAALPVALFIAEWRGFFPGLPKGWTEWVDDLQRHRYWGVVLGLVPGLVIMGIAATISLKWFT